MTIPIVYEDENILVINKPAGLLVHGGPKIKEKTLVDWLVKNYPAIKKVGEDLSRPGLVHRLDRDTAGLLVVAKNQKAFAELKKQFQERKVKKTYEAVVWGWPKKDQGKIIAPIGRGRFGKFTAGRGKRGKIKEAITSYKVKEKFTDQAGNKWSRLEVFPETGRTHQIRVHLNYLGHPIGGDRLYGGRKPKPPGFTGLALFAKGLCFQLFGKKFDFKIKL